MEVRKAIAEHLYAQYLSAFTGQQRADGKADMYYFEEWADQADAVLTAITDAGMQIVTIKSTEEILAKIKELHADLKLVEANIAMNAAWRTDDE